jgi:hypothetical protein
MKNDRLDAYQRRDSATQAGLLADQAQYALLETDIAPLRGQHTANLTRINALMDEVLAADNDDSAGVKAKTRPVLRGLLLRLSAALQAYAESAANTDEDLLHRVTLGADALRKADENTFARLAGGLLREAALRPAAELARREFTAADLAEAQRLLARFSSRLTPGRLADVDGKSAREVLSDLLAANQQLIRKIRQQLLPYKNSSTKHEVWLRFQGYSKVVLRKGGPNAKTQPGGGGEPTA